MASPKEKNLLFCKKKRRHNIWFLNWVPNFRRICSNICVAQCQRFDKLRNKSLLWSLTRGAESKGKKHEVSESQSKSNWAGIGIWLRCTKCYGSINCKNKCLLDLKCYNLIIQSDYSKHNWLKGILRNLSRNSSAHLDRQYIFARWK